MFDYERDETQALTVIDAPRAIGTPLQGVNFTPTIDQQVAAWLHAKYQRAVSEYTLSCYQRNMRSFRAVLHQAGIDLDSDPGLIATLAQGWASRPMLNEGPDLHPQVGCIVQYKKLLETGVSSGTYNNKVSSISSYYEYAIRHDWLTKNPMKKVEARPSNVRNYARHMEMEDVSSRLQGIDRSKLSGKRDYAIILLATMTGRRLAEFGEVQWGHISFDSHGRALCIFPHCKGGKQMEDILEPEVRDAILDYMRMLHGNDLETLPPETPLWINLHAIGKRQQLAHHSIRMIWIHWLGTSRVHTTRHTFALAMLKVGADVSEIASKLGHSNAATTGIYLQRAQQAENKYGAKLMQGFTGGDAPLAQERTPSKTETMRATILAHPEMSNVALARLLGVDASTVSRHRKHTSSSSSLDKVSES